MTRITRIPIRIGTITISHQLPECLRAGNQFLLQFVSCKFPWGLPFLQWNLVQFVLSIIHTFRWARFITYIGSTDIFELTGTHSKWLSEYTVWTYELTSETWSSFLPDKHTIHSPFSRSLKHYPSKWANSSVNIHTVPGVCMCTVLGIKPRALSISGKHSTTDLYSTAPGFIVMAVMKLKVNSISLLWRETRFSIFIVVCGSDSVNDKDLTKGPRPRWTSHLWHLHPLLDIPSVCVCSFLRDVQNTDHI